MAAFFVFQLEINTNPIVRYHRRFRKLRLLVVVQFNMQQIQNQIHDLHKKSHSIEPLDQLHLLTVKYQKNQNKMFDD